MKPTNKPEIECCGTRYLTVSITHIGKVAFIGLVSTPLNEDELRHFIHHRIGNKDYEVAITEISKSDFADVSSDFADISSRIKVIGLSTFERHLMPMVPEYVIDESKVVVTNRGVKIQKIDEGEE